jgi:ketosteroid isomerase-like protein
MNLRNWLVGVVIGALSMSLAAAAPTNEALKQQVADVERAFAATMKARDLKAFGEFLSEETVFFSGPVPLHGKAAVLGFWKKFYDKPQAPFSWEPKEVEVLRSGKLALSSGPVFDPSGKHVANYSSIWRLEAPGKWRIIFDKGWDECECAKGAK